MKRKEKKTEGKGGERKKRERQNKRGGVIKRIKSFYK